MNESLRRSINTHIQADYSTLYYTHFWAALQNDSRVKVQQDSIVPNIIGAPLDIANAIAAAHIVALEAAKCQRTSSQYAANSSQNLENLEKSESEAL